MRSFLYMYKLHNFVFKSKTGFLYFRCKCFRDFLTFFLLYGNELYTTNTTSIEPKNIHFGDLFGKD